MRTLIYQLFPVLLFSLFTTSLAAQDNWVPGYIIDSDDQRMEGQINDQEWVIGPYRIQFRASATATPEYYAPQDLKGFSAAGREYISVKVRVESSSLEADLPELTGEPVFRDDEVFAQHLISGQKNLYRYQDENRKEYFLIGPADEPIPLLNFYRLRNNATTKVRDIQYRSLLSYYLSGQCPRTDSLLRQTKYNEKDFTNLFLDWYDCTGSAYIMPGLKQLKFKVGLVAGADLTRPQVLDNVFSPVRHDWQLRPTLLTGISLHMLLPVRRYRSRITLQLLYGSYNFTSDQTGTTLFGITSSSFHRIRDKHIQGYLGVNQDFMIGKGAQVFYAGVGISLGYSLEHDYTNTRVQEPDFTESPISVVTFTADRRFSKYDSGLYAEGGARWGNFSAGLRYHRVLQVYSYEDFVFAANRFQLISQYTF